MTRSTKSILLTTLMVCGFAGIASAQSMATANVNYVNSDSNAKDLYLRSEQFVYDNLNLLKNGFNISDIYFDLDKADIRPDAQPVLDQLAAMLLSQKNLGVALTGHTDTRIRAYNNVMNLNRAEAAKTYLVSKGVEAERIVIEKYGRSNIKKGCVEDYNLSLEAQQLNRRTEFNIIYNNVNLAHVSACND